MALRFLYLTLVALLRLLVRRRSDLDRVSGALQTCACGPSVLRSLSRSTVSSRHALSARPGSSSALRRPLGTETRQDRGWKLVAATTTPLAAVSAAMMRIAADGEILNGILTTRFRINSLISTLVVATIIGGVVQRVTGGSAISANIPQSLFDFGSATWLGVPQPVYVLAVVAVVVWYLQQHTPVGRATSSRSAPTRRPPAWSA